MKKGYARRHPSTVAKTAFVRGVISAGLHAMVDERNGVLSQAGFRRAAKSGIAVAGGTLVADAIEHNEPARALLVIVGSAACMVMADRLIGDPDEEQESMVHGEKKE
ncbi:MAG: hypothetical protein AAF414_22925 [Pseudomonadota bacterium]